MVAGIVLMRQRPSTAKGIAFVTIEDETGTANLIVHVGTWERYRKITRHSQAWIVHGHGECKDTVSTSSSNEWRISAPGCRRCRSNRGTFSKRHSGLLVSYE
jgi:DNA polymerase III alpha subunit